jgi:hypothetical protein
MRPDPCGARVSELEATHAAPWIRIGGGCVARSPPTGTSPRSVGTGSRASGTLGASGSRSNLDAAASASNLDGATRPFEDAAS